MTVTSSSVRCFFLKFNYSKCQSKSIETFILHFPLMVNREKVVHFFTNKYGGGMSEIEQNCTEPYSTTTNNAQLLLIQPFLSIFGAFLRTPAFTCDARSIQMWKGVSAFKATAPALSQKGGTVAACRTFRRLARVRFNGIGERPFMFRKSKKINLRPKTTATNTMLLVGIIVANLMRHQKACSTMYKHLFTPQTSYRGLQGLERCPIRGNT